VLWSLLAVGSALLAFLVSVLVWAILPGPGSGRRVELDLAVELDGRQVASDLQDAGLITSARLMSVYLWLVRPAVELSPGPHLLNDALSPRDLVKRLGRLPTRPAVRAVIPEGYNHLQIAERLSELGVCSSDSFRKAVHNRALLIDLGISGDTAEGYLFPATYEMLVNSRPDSVVTLLVRQAKKRLEGLRQTHGFAFARLAREHGFQEREVLTLASIVERETAAADERRRIAGVFFNRLTDPAFVPKRSLQSDPTAAYGCLTEPERAPSCRGFDGRVTPAMLRDSQNRYNTYRHAGLPPGPIANPGASAIEAVLDPERTPYLFFVARGGKRHAFSRTFDEHNNAIRGDGGVR
jgi:UPF0755 protein